MAREHRQDVRAWLDYAEIDLSAARTLYQYHRPQPYEIICYHCQQAAEKAIKALYIHFDLPGGVPRKHDLSFLLNQMRHMTVISTQLRREADTLSAYGVVSRYPNEVEIDDSHAQQALEYAEAILRWARALVDQD